MMADRVVLGGAKECASVAANPSLPTSCFTSACTLPLSKRIAAARTDILWASELLDADD